jgi:hypothetical protein
VGLAFVARVVVAEGWAELDCAVFELEALGAGVAVDCATPDRATINNPSRTIR